MEENAYSHSYAKATTRGNLAVNGDLPATFLTLLSLAANHGRKSGCRLEQFSTDAILRTSFAMLRDASVVGCFELGGAAICENRTKTEQMAHQLATTAHVRHTGQCKQ